jgi:ATPase subunit of ABC transporter with duplicated ATPase domains
MDQLRTSHSLPLLLRRSRRAPRFAAAGKSTLLKLILGELEPSAGHVSRNPKLRVAFFNQHHTAQLDLSSTPLDYIMRLYPGQKPEVYRAHLSSFGLSGDLALQPIRTLSGARQPGRMGRLDGGAGGRVKRSFV